MASAELNPLPLPLKEWKRLVAVLDLSIQQTRIIELILRNCRDKRIAAEMNLKSSTVRMHLSRIFRRLEIEDRMSLVLMLFAASHKMPYPVVRHRK